MTWPTVRQRCRRLVQRIGAGGMILLGCAEDARGARAPDTSACVVGVRVGVVGLELNDPSTAEVHDYHDVREGVLASSLAKRAHGYLSLGFPDPR
ncbi:MAG: hypothetical protein M4D85_12935 [Actinomycetota bacterium]|nr:hypothetical protein [Actinomycetota bacterium]